MPNSLADKSVVIVGGSTGLGFSAARTCVAEGASVVVVGRKPESVREAEEALGQRCQGLVGDASDSTTSDRAVEAALDTFGGFDALYHVAGGSGRKFGDGPLHELTDSGVRDTLSLNLESLMFSNRAAVRSFMDRDVPGVVLNMGSVLGSSPSPRYFATHTYAAAKSAINGFTKSCAAYYASREIRFNVIAPALVETPMARRAAADDSITRFIRTKQPLDGGRIGRPDDLDEAVIYLLSDASHYVTGQVLTVDGGWSVSEGQIPE